ncbi:MAG: cupin [Bdellovibrionota bacterium]
MTEAGCGIGKQSIERIEKPWGYELIWAKTNHYIGKILHIRRGHKLSLQYHRIKEETVFLKTGKMMFVTEDEKGVMKEMPLFSGEAFHIFPGRKHRMIALEDCDVFEVSTPHLDDVIRIEDSYGRTGTSMP